MGSKSGSQAVCLLLSTLHFYTTAFYDTPVMPPATKQTLELALLKVPITVATYIMSTKVKCTVWKVKICTMRVLINREVCIGLQIYGYQVVYPQVLKYHLPFTLETT